MPYKDPEAARERSRKYYEANKDRVWKNPDGTWRSTLTYEQRIEINRRWYTKNREKWLARRREIRAAKAKHGKCPICRAKKVKLVWDHDHTTGEHRGWICHACNLMLGHARDSVKTLRAAIEYLDGSTRSKTSTSRVRKTMPKS